MPFLDTMINILAAAVAAGTPLVYAALGELITEKTGVLNLGVEGMMLVGAVTGFMAAAETGSIVLGILCGMAAGSALALIFAVLTLTLMANQVASGLALTIFGIGLSAFLGLDYTNLALKGLPEIHIPGLSSLPVVGKLLFSYDMLIYTSFILLAGVSWFLCRTRSGLMVRGIGEAPHVGHALGYRVIRTRYLAVLFGGAMAGLGGVYLAVVYTPMWVEGMTAGRGWIALVLVIFSTWRPVRVLIGAYLFGGLTILQLHIQGMGFDIPAQFLAMLPYVATIVVLVFISRNPGTIHLNAPAALGSSYHPEKGVWK